MPRGEDASEFRRGLISSIGAHKIENPNETAVDYARIFPDLFKRLRDHFYDERKRQLGRNVENILKFLSDDKGQLSAKEQLQVRQTLDTLGKKFGYTDTSARDAVVFLMRKRYA
jgi:hypothetical protein